jgi:methyl-accepting chemotaxis protein/methyl-accepting chemotaxis protein-1 (serine sensor receptor)
MTNWTIGKKLGISFTVLIALLLGLGLSSMIAVGKLETALDLTGTKSSRKVELAGVINESCSAMAAAERGMIMFAAAKDNGGVEDAERAYQDNFVDLKKAAAELRSLAILAETKERLAEIERYGDEWKSNLGQVATMIRGGSLEEAVKLARSKNNDLFKKIGSTTDEITSAQNKLIVHDLESATSQASTSRLIAIGLSLVAFGVGVVVLLVLRQVNLALRRLAAQLSEGANQLAGAAGQVSAAGQTLAQGSSEQAASLEETSASSEEISTMTKRNAEHSEEAARLMTGTTESVEGANKKMEEMIHSMKEITASSGKISKIIKVIDEIAFQTNILALNAAVEAARAGEAGKGFAVVADEVRNLAQRCAQAARDTAELIEESINRSNDGSNRLAQVSDAMGEITEQSSKVKELVDEIHTGSKEQARGIEQVAGAVNQMQVVTQSNAASAEESAAAGKELSSQSDTLRTLVNELNDMVGKSSEQGLVRSLAGKRKESRVPALAAAGSRTVAHRPLERRNPDQEFPLDESFN